MSYDQCGKVLAAVSIFAACLCVYVPFLIVSALIQWVSDD